MWSFVIICALCCVILTDANIIVNVTTKYKEKTMICRQGNEVSITAIEGEPLTFSVQLDATKSDDISIKCIKDELNSSLMSANGVNETTEINVTRTLGGRWHCRLNNLPNDVCFINIHVRLKVSPQKILQHNMVIPTYMNTNTDTDFDHFGSVLYTDGHNVKLNCIVEDNTPVTHNITLKYLCPRQENEKDQGFQLTSGSIMKDCYLICIYKYINDITVTKVEFVPHSVENGSYIKVNGHMACQNWTIADSYKTLKCEPNYIFFDENIVNVSCHTETEGYAARSSCINEINEINSIYEANVSSFPNIFKCSICNESEQMNYVTIDIRKLPSTAFDPYSEPIKPSENVHTNPLESPNDGSPAAITWSVIGGVVVIIGIVVYVVKMWKRKRAADSQNINEAILQREDHRNSVYEESYDHKSNYVSRDICSEPQPKSLRQRNYTTTPKNLTANTDNQNTEEKMPQTVDHCNSVYIDQSNQGHLYAKAMPKHLRPRNTDTAPIESYPTKFVTPQYLNKSELEATLGEDVYANEKEATLGEDVYANEKVATLGDDVYPNDREAALGEDVYANEKNIGKDIYDNVSQESFYGNNENPLYDKATYSKPCKKIKN